MTDAFQKGLKPKKIKANEINSKIKDLDCEKSEISMNAREEDHSSNQEIDFEPTKAVTVIYSIALFKGILDKYKPDEFQFYKAVNAQGKPDIVFRVLKKGNTVYRGDLSGLRP